ncbi:MAG: thymidylate synthase [Christensenellaceae bacterium]|nr:thymidylate synthase [Christensenellaceae bacterium]
MSYADKIFINDITNILDRGFSDENLNVRPKWSDGTPAHTKKLFCLVNRYNLANEFPIITVRKIQYKKAIDELLWIWSKKSNKIADLNSHIWDAWADENGTIGKAYGYQLNVKHKYSEGMFDQVDRVLYDLKNNPQSRRILTNIFVHSDLNEMALYPCAYSLTFNVAGDVLNMVLNQRSQDMIVANNWNVVQYAVLQHMMAQVSGFKVGEFVHIIADAHIYDRHFPIAKEIIKNPIYDAPLLRLNPDIKNFYDFTVDDVEIVSYEATPLKKPLEVAE